MPEAARAFMTEGVRRLAAYQDLAYARLYLDRLAPIRDADAKAGADGQLLAETARHLAVRMSYEDVIRVAQAKIDPARFARIAAQMGIKPDQPFAVTEFLKPGVEEFCSILPPWLARRDPRVRRTSCKIRPRAHWGMEINTASMSGFLRFYILAKLRRWRPRTWRFQEEQRDDRKLAATHLACRAAVRRVGDRDRRVRPPHQRLWRHPQARQRQLSADRRASDRAGARRSNSGPPSRRCDCQRPHRGAARSRRRGAVEMPCGIIVYAGPRHRRRITFVNSTRRAPSARTALASRARQLRSADCRRRSRRSRIAG